MASKYNWLADITYKQGKKAALIAFLLVIIVFPLFYVLLTTLKFPSNWFSGGLHWPALVYAMWEQLTGIAMITALLGIGKQAFNKESVFCNKLSRSAFAVYIFHPVVVISIALVAKNWAVDPAFKLLVVAPLALIFSFLLGSLFVMIPGVNRII